MLVKSTVSTQAEKCRYFIIHCTKQEVFGSGLTMEYRATHPYAGSGRGGQ